MARASGGENFSPSPEEGWRATQLWRSPGGEPADTAIRSRNRNRADPNAMHLWRSLMALLVALALPAVAMSAAAEEPAASSAGEPDGSEPQFVRPFVPIGRSRSVSNPVWSTTRYLVAFG